MCHHIWRWRWQCLWLVMMSCRLIISKTSNSSNSGSDPYVDVDRRMCVHLCVFVSMRAFVFVRQESWWSSLVMINYHAWFMPYISYNVYHDMIYHVCACLGICVCVPVCSHVCVHWSTAVAPPCAHLNATRGSAPMHLCWFYRLRPPPL